MANFEHSGIEVHFTDNHYATKQEVQKKLQISNADSFWNRILEYRSKFTQELSLVMLTREKLKICITPKIADRINQVSLGLTKAAKRFMKLDNKTRTDEMVRDRQAEKILKVVADRYSVNVEDGFINNVIRDNVSTIFSEKLVLVNYYNVIKELKNASVHALDEDYLGELYKIINGYGELTEFYRLEEISDPRQSAQVGHVYIHAPVNRIEDMILSLFNFIETSDQALFVKLTAIYFFFGYIKPFMYFSEELAIAVVKAYLAHEDFEDIAPYLNIEVLLSRDNEGLEYAIYNVKKTNDLTYLLDYLLVEFEEILADFMDTMVKAEKDILVDEYYRLEPVTEPVYPSIEPSLPPKLTEEEIVPKEEAPVVVTPVIEVTEPAPTPTPVVTPLPEVKEEVPLTPKETPEPLQVKKVDEVLTPESGIVTSSHIAIMNVPVGLSEEDAERLSDHLLELNPTLKPGEVYFYARHCTLGKYYTIRQYKETMGVAYETARTSMDHLAEEGYYRKEQYKNKFIYTPVARR